jgi:hypothetical protein
MLRVFVRIIVHGILSVPLTLLVWWGISPFVNFETIGSWVAQWAFYNQPAGGPWLRGLGVAAVVDLVVSFGFLSGIWFLWTQGRKERQRIHNSRQGGNWLRHASIFFVATVCALPPSFYVLLVKSKFHSGLADTPAEQIESSILIITICAVALCGIAILGRFCPSSGASSNRAQP